MNTMNKKKHIILTDSRVVSLIDTLQNIINKLTNDELLDILKQDSISEDFVSIRVQEIVENSLNSEKERYIEKLKGEIADLKSNTTKTMRFSNYQNNKENIEDNSHINVSEIAEKYKKLKRKYKRKLEKNDKTEDFSKKLSEYQDILCQKTLLEKQMIEGESAYNKLVKENDQLNKTLLDLQNSTYEKEKSLNDREKALYDKETVVYDKEKFINDKERIMKDKDKTFNDKEKIMIKEREKALNEKEKHMNERERTINDREKTIYEKEDIMMNKEKTIEVMINEKKDNTYKKLMKEKDEIYRKYRIINKRYKKMKADKTYIRDQLKKIAVWVGELKKEKDYMRNLQENIKINLTFHISEFYKEIMKGIESVLKARLSNKMNVLVKENDRLSSELYRIKGERTVFEARGLTQRKEFEGEVVHWRKEIDGKKEEIERIERKHKEDINKLKESYDQELRNLHNVLVRLDKGNESLAMKYEEEMAFFQTNYLSDLKNLKIEYKNKLNKLQGLVETYRSTGLGSKESSLSMRRITYDVNVKKTSLGGSFEKEEKLMEIEEIRRNLKELERIAGKKEEELKHIQRIPYKPDTMDNGKPSLYKSYHGIDKDRRHSMKIGICGSGVDEKDRRLASLPREKI